MRTAINTLKCYGKLTGMIGGIIGAFALATSMPLIATIIMVILVCVGLNEIS